MRKLIAKSETETLQPEFEAFFERATATEVDKPPRLRDSTRIPDYTIIKCHHEIEPKELQMKNIAAQLLT